MFINSSDERDIYRNIVQIARAMDERDWEGISNLTLPEATADFGTGPVSSATEIISVLRRFLDSCGPSQHLIGNVLIDVTGDTATSRSYVADMHLGIGELEGEYFRTLGDYHDSWLRTSDGWKLTDRTKRHNGTMGNIDVLAHGPNSESSAK